jgi:hypothetical protein
MCFCTANRFSCAHTEIRDRAGLCEHAQAGAQCLEQTVLADGTPPSSGVCRQCQSGFSWEFGSYGLEDPLFQDDSPFDNMTFGEIPKEHLEMPADEYTTMATEDSFSHTSSDLSDIDELLASLGTEPVDFNWDFLAAESTVEEPPPTPSPDALPILNSTIITTTTKAETQPPSLQQPTTAPPPRLNIHQARLQEFRRTRAHIIRQALEQSYRVRRGRDVAVLREDTRKLLEETTRLFETLGRYEGVL